MANISTIAGSPVRTRRVPWTPFLRARRKALGQWAHAILAEEGYSYSSSVALSCMFSIEWLLNRAQEWYGETPTVNAPAMDLEDFERASPLLRVNADAPPFFAYPQLSEPKFYVDPGMSDVVPGYAEAGQPTRYNVPLPADARVLIASGPVDGSLPPDTAVWLG